MDLDGMEKEPNRGGRPPKDDEKSHRVPDGKPYTQEHDEGYWSVIWNKHFEQHLDIHEIVSLVADDAHVQPRVVVYEVHNNDVYDLENYTDEWEQWDKWINGEADSGPRGSSGFISEIDGITGTGTEEQTETGLGSLLKRQ